MHTALQLLASACALWCVNAFAADAADAYPSKPVRVIVPFSAGGGVDMLARLVGVKLSDALGQSFVIENRTGAGGTIGVALAARATPDGHVLVLTSNSLVFNATIYKNLPYDTLADLAPVSLVATSPNVLVTHPSLPAKSVQDFVRFAKARPGDLTYGTGGAGGSSHICAEYFFQSTGVKAVHVPYKGIPQALSDLFAGRTTFSFAPIAPVPGYVKAGKVRALGVSSAKRSAIMPEVPTIAESGVPRFEYTTWYGMLAPAAVPAGIVAKLNEEVRKALALPDVRERMLGSGVEPAWSTPKDFSALVKTEISKWAPLIRASGVQP